VEGRQQDAPAGAERQPVIRAAVAADAGALADLFWQVRTESVPHIPMIAHPRERVEPFVRQVLLEEVEVLVAEEEGGRLVGFLSLMSPDVLGHLYLAAGHTGRGLGGRFLSLAQERFPEGLQLWAFQSNLGALRFYERHGFVPVEWTDGDNEEGAPDVRMVWRPTRHTPEAPARGAGAEHGAPTPSTRHRAGATE
jgi:GNAT superfamily N-acetyltransferase